MQLGGNDAASLVAVGLLLQGSCDAVDLNLGAPLLLLSLSTFFFWYPVAATRAAQPCCRATSLTLLCVVKQAPDISFRTGVTVCGSGRLCVTVCGSGRLCVTVCGSGRLCVTVCGSGRMCVTVCGSGRLCVTVCGSGRMSSEDCCERSVRSIFDGST